jgi:HSP20 family protein
MNAVAEKEVKTTPAPVVETPREYVAPSVNILETPDAYIVEAEMPGVKKDGLSLTVDDGVLTLTGRRQSPVDAAAVYRETPVADYRRAFTLDPAIETERITARIDQGVLTVTLPKAEKAKPRQIAVN